MKRAFMSELAIVRTLVPSIAGVGLFIFVVLTAVRASNGDSDMSAAGAFAISAMSPIMAMTSLAGLDNQNGWERYRATLHLTQRHRQRTLPVHHYFLGHHDVRGRAVEYRRHPDLKQHGYPLHGRDRL